MNLKNQTLVGEELIIDDTKSFNAIGKDVVLKDCKIKISVPTKALGIRGKIIGGEVTVKKELHGFHWLEAHLEGVRFTGSLTNNRFGNLNGYGNSEGFITKCNFRDTRLRDCEFFNCDVESIVFPGWPCICIKNIDLIHREISSYDVPDSLADFLDYIEDDDLCDDDLVALTLDCEKISKKESIPMEDLKAWAAAIQEIEQKQA